MPDDTGLNSSEMTEWHFVEKKEKKLPFWCINKLTLQELFFILAD